MTLTLVCSPVDLASFSLKMYNVWKRQSTLVYTQSLAPPNPSIGTLMILSAVSPSEVKTPIKSSPVKHCLLTFQSVLKLCSTEMAVLIAHVAKCSFESDRFQAVMKKGLVTPLIKKPGLDTADMKNFRPITNLTTVSKILERLALAWLQPHIIKSLN